MEHKEDTQSIYTPELIAFAQTGVEFASLLEQRGEKDTLIDKLLKVLPRLYSLMLSLPSYFYNPEEDLIEEYITEESYEHIRGRLETLLGSDDLYLSTNHADIEYSDTPIAISLSEQLADIYQHVGNLLGVIRQENVLALPAAIGRCRLYWQEHWGLALISALGALHQLYVAKSQVDMMEWDDEEGADLDDINMDEYEEE